MSNRRRPILLSSAAICVAAVVGCAETITYSTKTAEQGKALQAAGKLEEAAAAYQSATKQNPSNIDAYAGLGDVDRQLGREQQSLQAYKTALDVMPDVNPRSPEPSAVRAVAARESIVDGLGQTIAAAASKDVELASLVAKANAANRAVDWYAVARADAALGDADNAIDAYEHAMNASDNGDRAIAKSYGLYLAQVGQKQKAEATLRRAYQLSLLPHEDPEIDAALRKLGVVPGPSLLEASQLHHPPLPKGPLPELEINVRNNRDATQPAN